jgi:hypothetical protein
MSKAKARVFVPLRKVDEEQRLVYGVITAQEIDQSGEMMDYESSKPNFEKWSSDIEAASGGLSKGNVRVMHGLSVAGKLTDISFDDDAQQIEVCAKVVDDTEWNKVLEGCYTGFSVGGRYGKKWNETIEGQTIKKFTAVPNEVSLVDNPCVKSATFQLVKADGAEEEVSFADEILAKSDITASGEIDGETNAPGTGSKPKQVKKLDSDPKTKKPDPKKTPGGMKAEKTVSNEELAKRATELAKEANDGSTWTDHIEAAREELTKAETTETEEPANDPDAGASKEEDESSAEGADEAETSDDAGKGGTEDETVEKVTPPGVKQKWEASDGTTFEKKADAEAHEAKLTEEPTEAQKLAARLEKASNPDDPVETPELMSDFGRLAKVFDALSTPFGEDGKPKLEKNMYTVNRFSYLLMDMASLARSIAKEGKREGDDETDAQVSNDLTEAVNKLGASFLTYATDQVTELLAGMDDDVVVCYHDYYYDAVQNDGEDSLAKDVCEVINKFRDPSREQRETLAKAFGIVEEGVELTDELSPPMQKRFDQLTADNEELRKVAATAVDKVEELAKRLKAVEDKPEPRAPNSSAVALKEGDGNFLGKAVSSNEDRMTILQEMLAEHGPDGMATMMIKMAQSSGGQKLHLKS